MKLSKKCLQLFFIIFSIFSLQKVQAISFGQGDFKATVKGKMKEETFFGKNIKLLNDDNEMDKAWYAQHTFDLNLHTLYGTEQYGHEAIEFYFNFRNKARWGNPTNIASTTGTPIKLTDYVIKDHNHSLGKMFPFTREVWLKISLNAILGIESDEKHFLMFGAFPFQLGRGIALGDAFAVNPGLLGFYSDDTVDQYAFGGKLSGDLIADRLTYDIYAAVIENKSDSFSRTAQKIHLQHLSDCYTRDGRRYPFRGFGNINYVLAGRLNWIVFDTIDHGRLTFEPYIMYNHDPEQRVEFAFDADSKLGTAGFAAEWEESRFEGGFDTAFNFGRQRVLSLDRNTISAIRNSDGLMGLQYTHILDADPNDPNASPKKVLVTDANKAIVNAATRDVDLNGQSIGGGLYNALDRFREGYKNKYKGWMVVADAAYWFKKKVFKAAATIGMASGDESPNRNLNDPKDSEVDGDYQGFLGLQEIYSGKRVKSAFVLGARRLPRPLTAPEVDSRFAPVVSEFTNIVYGGVGFHWMPKDSKRKIEINPNVLIFGQQYATKAFDIQTGQTTDCYARRYLGVELNLFAQMLLLDNLKLFMVGAGFISGTHYDDILGKPLSAAQRAYLDRRDSTGYDLEPEPLLGNDNAFTFNVGLEYKF